MKVMLSPIQQRAQMLRTRMLQSVLNGSYSDYSILRDEYTKLAVENFNQIKDLHFPKFSVSLFSLTGLRMAYFYLRELFRTKTPEEIQLKKLAMEEHRRRLLDAEM